ncbi:MAG: hypothetical protein JO107_17110 [Hyphomicrobiales bacterium]|nr:hypothetical protein [Hyphomicrobiales bacterium]MBV8664805.1 hypothetical protein [Hyphomicrobiales bacterium]
MGRTAMLGFLMVSLSAIGERRAERRAIGSAITKSEAVESGYVEHSSSPTDTVRKNTVRGDKASAMPSCHQLLKDAPNCSVYHADLPQDAVKG